MFNKSNIEQQILQERQKELDKLQNITVGIKDIIVQTDQ
jgi:hypothetical protein